jgi:type II restriction enzyme
MGKIQEAQDILKTLGLPRPQQNEMAALTLLVLAGLSEDTPWVQARQQSLRIHDMLGEMQTRYGRQYAENTRETIRRQVIHQFVQAGLVLRNPDDPTLPTNSPRTHYALSEPTLDTLRAYRSGDWPEAAKVFLENQRALIETYRQQRDQYKVPLIMEGGVEYHLSPGAHNELQVLVIEEFGPRFAPGAKVLYVGDTANKTLHIDESGFRKLGIPIPSHDKLPDVVLYDEGRNWLYLIEAVTSHGPMSPKRQLELRELLGKGKADLIYVTAFPDFNTFKNFLLDIAWETEVWVADRPTHLIHFNGDRFLRPHV